MIHSRICDFLRFENPQSVQTSYRDFSSVNDEPFISLYHSGYLSFPPLRRLISIYNVVCGACVQHCIIVMGGRILADGVYSFDVAQPYPTPATLTVIN